MSKIVSASLLALSIVSAPLWAQTLEYGELEVALRTHPSNPENLDPGDTMSGASPAINEAGQITVRVNVAANSQGHALWFGADGSGGVVFELGNDIDSDFMSNALDINGLGQAVFERTRTASDDGLWVYDPDTGNTVRVTSLPFGTETWSSPRIDDEGIIGFRSRFSGDYAFHSVDPATDDAQLHAAQAGPLDPDGPWEFLFTPSYGPNRTITSKVWLNDPSGAEQIRRFAADGSSESIAETEITDNESLFSGFDNSVGLNGQGDVAFIANLINGGRGVFLSADGSIIEIAVEDEAGPVTDIEFFAPDVNNAGQVVFRAFNENGDRAVFVGDGTNLVEVASRSDTLETSMGTAQINRNDSDIVFGGNPAINNDGTVVFSADLADAEDIDVWFGRALLIASMVAGPNATEASPDEIADILGPPSPNPVHETATFAIAVENGQHVTVEVFDATGRRVQTLYSDALASGMSEELTLDASVLPPGVYMIRATGEDFTKTRRITVIR